MDKEKSVFLKVPKRKEAFLDQKNIGSKTTSICIFSKGLVHGFCQKMEIF